MGSRLLRKTYQSWKFLSFLVQILLYLGIVQESVNSAGLCWSNPVHFQKPSFQDWLLASFLLLSSEPGKSFLVSLRSGAMLDQSDQIVYGNNVIYDEHPVLLWGSGVLSKPTWLIPSKNLDTKPQVNISPWPCLVHIVTHSYWEN